MEFIDLRIDFAFKKIFGNEFTRDVSCGFTVSGFWVADLERNEDSSVFSKGIRFL